MEMREIRDSKLIQHIEDPGLRTRVINNIVSYKDESKTIWGFDKLPEMVDHGAEHAENVFRLLDKMLVNFPVNLATLKDEELFCLIMSTWLHDIGRKGPEGFYEFSRHSDVHKKHGVTGGEILAKNYRKFGLYQGEVEPICLIVKYHQSKAPLTGEHKKYLGKDANPSTVIPRCVRFKHYLTKETTDLERMPFLTALLSLADACDVHQSRCFSKAYIEEKIKANKELNESDERLIPLLMKNRSKEAQKTICNVKKNKELRDLQKDHYLKHLSVIDVQFISNEIILIRDSSIESKFFEQALEQIEKEIERGREILAAEGINIERVREFNPQQDTDLEKQSKQKRHDILILRDPYECLEKIVEILVNGVNLVKKAKGAGLRVGIKRLMTSEFTSEAYKMIFEEESEKRSKFQQLLKKYTSYIREYVIRDPLHDWHIYGTTNSTEVNEATIKFIEDVFSPEHETSALGATELIDRSFGLFIFGIVTKGELRAPFAEITDFLQGILLIGEKVHLRPWQGFYTQDKDIIKLWNDSIWEPAKDKALREGCYFETTSLDGESKEKIREKINQVIRNAEKTGRATR